MSVNRWMLLSVLLSHACAAYRNSPQSPLVGPVWVLMEMKGLRVETDSPPTLEFASDGKLSGRAFCNYYQAVYKTSGNDLSIEPTAMTAMSCLGEGKPKLFTDSIFIQTLKEVNRLEFDSGGGLVLRTKNAETIRVRHK